MSQKSYSFLENDSTQIVVSKVPDTVLETIPFSTAWEMKHEANQKIWTSRGECGSNRPYSVFLHSPPRSSKDRTYMFSEDGSNPKFVPLPDTLKELYAYVCEQFNTEFNQVVMNWYENKHFLATHIDWNDGTLTGPIVCVTLLQGDLRVFKIHVPKSMKPIISNAKIVTRNGTMISMHNEGVHFHHGIEKTHSSLESKRVSITFRCYKSMSE